AKKLQGQAFKRGTAAATTSCRTALRPKLIRYSTTELQSRARLGSLFCNPSISSFWLIQCLELRVLPCAPMDARVPQLPAKEGIKQRLKKYAHRSVVSDTR